MMYCSDPDEGKIASDQDSQLIISLEIPAASSPAEVSTCQYPALKEKKLNLNVGGLQSLKSAVQLGRPDDKDILDSTDLELQKGKQDHSGLEKRLARDDIVTPTNANPGDLLCPTDVQPTHSLLSDSSRKNGLGIFDDPEMTNLMLRKADPNVLIESAKYLLAHYPEARELRKLDLATSFLRRAAELDISEQDKAGVMDKLGLAFQLYFEDSGDLGDINQAITNQQQAVSLIPHEHPKRPSYLSNLGRSYCDRFDQTGKDSDLKEAIKVQEQALSLAPENDPSIPRLLSQLCASLNRRYENTGNQEDLERIVEYQKRAVLITPDADPNKPLRMCNLGMLFQSLFLVSGELKHLENAVNYKANAVALTSDMNDLKLAMLSTLGVSLASRFDVIGMLDDLEEAIRVQYQAVLLTPDGHPEISERLYNLGSSCESLFLQTGSQKNLGDAIKYQEKAVLHSREGHSSRLVYLSSLGKALKRRFDWSGILVDLEEAIGYQQQAVLLSRDGNIDKPGRLNNLAIFLIAQFEHTGMTSDLEDAITYLQQGILLTSDKDNLKPCLLNNLGAALESLFEETKVEKYLERAIDNQNLALDLMQDGRPEKLIILGSIGNTWITQFEHTRVPAHLGKGIDYLEKAVALSKDSNKNGSEWLSSLGKSLGLRFEQSQKKVEIDLDNAIKLQQKAISVLPSGHANKPDMPINLGHTFEIKFGHTGIIRDLEEAVSFIRAAATSTIGNPLKRFKAARRWAVLATQHHLPSDLEAYTLAMRLIPKIAWIGDNITKRHLQLKSVGDFPREAAAFAIKMQKFDLALEWLEQGRSIVWNQLLSLHTPIDKLKNAHPDTAAVFVKASNSLYNAGVQQRQQKFILSYKEKFSIQEESRQHHRLAEQWESLLHDIRLLPGFEDFLLPKRLAILKEGASSGPIVVVNIHQSRCDALVLEPGKENVHHVPLEKLTYQDVERMQEVLKQNLSTHHLRGRELRGGRPYPLKNKSHGQVQSALGSMLSELYIKIVHPILESLSMKKMTISSSLPRIWWCPTGPLTFLPLHAACQNIQNGGEETSKYVISSYIPTINALLEARKAERPIVKLFFTVGMMHTPNLNSLPNAETELADIRQLFGPGSKFGWEYKEARNEEANTECVLTGMSTSSWAHLACHAVQDVAASTESGLCLHDQRLKITDIIAKPFPHADLVFLSACETATGDEQVADEAVHITGAMLGSGYRGVIGTMWSIPDEVAPIVTSNVYKSLLSRNEPDSTWAAHALHEAMKEVRKLGSSEELFYAWVPFVHYGV